MVDPEYVEANPEEAKAEARERGDAEATARPTQTFMERLAELARELEPDMDGVCTADQLLSGIDTPRELTFDEFMVFLRECMVDLKLHLQPRSKTHSHSKDAVEFTPMGHLRAERFTKWVITLEQIEWKCLAFKTALTTHRLPLDPSKQKSMNALSLQIKQFIL